MYLIVIEWTSWRLHAYSLFVCHRSIPTSGGHHRRHRSDVSVALPTFVRPSEFTLSTCPLCRVIEHTRSTTRAARLPPWQPFAGANEGQDAIALRLVESSNTNVSGASEVLLSRGKLILRKSSCCVFAQKVISIVKMCVDLSRKILTKMDC